MHIEDDLVLVSRRWRQLAVDGGNLQQEVFSLQELCTYLQVSRHCSSVAGTNNLYRIVKASDPDLPYFAFIFRLNWKRPKPDP